MSLAPAERRALALIEDSLHHADPGLARMLTQFRLPLARGGWRVVIGRLPRLGPFIPLLVAAAVVSALVLAVLLGPSGSLPCGARGETGFAATAAQAGGCPPTGGRGHNPGGP